MSTVKLNEGMVVVSPRQTRTSQLRAKKYSGLSSTASQSTINIAFGSALPNKDLIANVGTPRCSLQMGTPRSQTIPRQRSAIPVSTSITRKDLRAQSCPNEALTDAANAKQNKETEQTARKPMTTFIRTKKEFIKSKAELLNKQQAVLELLKSLKEQYLSMTGMDYQELEMQVIYVGGWSAVELTRLCKTHCGEGERPNKITLGPKVVSNLSHILTSSTDKCLKLCGKVVEKIKDIIDKMSHGIITYGDEINTFVVGWKYEVETLSADYSTTTDDMESTLRDVVETFTILYREKVSEEEKNLSLKLDVQNLRQQLETAKKGSSVSVIEPDTATNCAQCENHLKELEKNRETHAGQLRKMNEMSMRIRELQRRLHAEETKNRESLATIKTLDAQGKLRDSANEARARTLRANAQSCDAKLAELMKQHEELEASALSLRGELEDRERRERSVLAEAEREREQCNAERARAVELERRALHAESRVQELERLTQDENSPLTRENREMQLLTELEQLKNALESANNYIAECKKEKIQFIGSLAKIADAENKTQSKAELLSKDRQILMLQHKLRLAETNQTVSDNQQLLTKLEQKDQMISRLKNIVRSQEELQKRSDFQRVRQEEKISSLEHELHDTRSGRSKALPPKKFYLF